MTPQPYNRLYKLTGVKGFTNELCGPKATHWGLIECLGVQPKVDNLSSHGFLPQAEMDAFVRNTSTLF